MKNILVPIDFSVKSFNALQYAEGLAQQTGCSLILVHIIPIQMVGATASPVLVIPDNETQKQYTEKMTSLAEKIAAENQYKFKVEPICTTGVFLDEMLRQIHAKKADLIVMGTRGANTILDKLLGTNTISMLQNGICPVLAIPALVTYTGINIIAYASDLKGHEDIFLNQLNDFAKHFEPEICIVHVKTKKELKAETDLLAFEEIKRNFPGMNYSFAEVKGESAVDGIQAFIKENSVDVLAMAIHERGFWEELFHSSVSRQLAFESTVPLLALPEKNYDNKGATEAKVGRFMD